VPATCFFTLNKQRMSRLFCPGFGSIPAFSGNKRYTNDPASTAVPKDGPLPTGTYYIVDRPTGGRHAALNDALMDLVSGTHRTEWFALYRAGGIIGDYTYINGVRRGNFRLHPTGYWGISEGCVTLPHPRQFEALSTYLKSQTTAKVPGTQIEYYGTVVVR